jgi:hypothetical protein
VLLGGELRLKKTLSVPRKSRGYAKPTQGVNFMHNAKRKKAGPQ